MTTMKIYFSSLTTEAQTEYISTFGSDDNAESGVFPIAIIDREEIEDDE